jgi:hypothetical protein
MGSFAEAIIMIVCRSIPITSPASLLSLNASSEAEERRPIPKGTSPPKPMLNPPTAMPSCSSLQSTPNGILFRETCGLDAMLLQPLIGSGSPPRSLER